MAHWLMKTEPHDYSWDRLVAEGETSWTGVRNPQAAANMRAMKLGDEVFFYRSVVEPAIVGVMAVSAEWSADPSDPSGKRGHVMVKPVRPVRDDVSLKAIKADPRFADSTDVGNLEEILGASGISFVVEQDVTVDPVDALLDAMDRDDAELLVIGIRHRSPVGKLLMGSTAQRLLLACPKPVLAVKPALVQ